MKIIGLTGGISTGKTTVSNYLSSKYNLPVLDADIYAREAVVPSSPILQDIFDRWGNTLENADGTLNRKALGEIIFKDPTAKQWLESKIHPFVRERFQQELTKLQQEGHHQTVVFAIPLLFEAKLTHLVTEIWVVYCDRATQIARLQARNQLTPEQALARINNQLPIEQKIAQADYVLDNNDTTAELHAQCDALLGC